MEDGLERTDAEFQKELARFRNAFVNSSKTGKPDAILGEMKTGEQLAAVCVKATFACENGEQLEEVQEAFGLWHQHLGL
ncbi:MAG: hypothetical protein WDO68_22200 [Gammaproteobacteria bacterium]